MIRRRDSALYLAGLATAAIFAAGYQLGRARADGIPSAPTMFYGVSLDENGAPVSGTRDLRVRFFDAEMGGAQLCETLANSTTVTQGRARIALSETCRTAVQQNVNVWVEFAVGGNVVGARSRVGAVPYAVEAQRANDLTPAAQERIRSLSTEFFVSQTDDADTTGNGDWRDVPGVAVASFVTTAPSTVLFLRASGFSYGLGGTNGWANCGYRFVVDASPLGAAPAAVQVGVDTAHFGWATPWTAIERTTLAPGTHNVRLQTARMPSGGDANCRTPTTIARMHLTLR
jgi:hypothetical protein